MMSQQALTPGTLREILWGIAKKHASIRHPWFRGVIDRTLTRGQVIAGERQHFLRVMHNAEFFNAIRNHAEQEGDADILSVAEVNYQEELGEPEDHRDLLYRLLAEAGVSRAEAEQTKPTPETAIAIEKIVTYCHTHSALQSMAFVGFVEAQNAGPDGVARPMYEALTEHYGFSSHAAETFLVHSEIDEDHGQRQIDLVCEKAVTNEQQKAIIQAVKEGTDAFTLEWDGHLRAAKEIEKLNFL